MWSHGVLAGIDNSPNSAHVASVAAKIAAQCGIPLTLISVISHDVDSLRAQAETTLGHALAVAAAAGAHAQSRILVGKHFEQILSTAKALSADLIVVGRHGESNLVRTPFGGTAQKIIGLAEGPVLVVRS
jgi:nucleotide-binding universal stress UspA family protein